MDGSRLSIGTVKFVVCIFDTLYDNLEIKSYFAKFSKGSWLQYSDEHFSYRIDLEGLGSLSLDPFYL